MRYSDTQVDTYAYIRYTHTYIFGCGIEYICKSMCIYLYIHCVPTCIKIHISILYVYVQTPTHMWNTQDYKLYKVEFPILAY